MKTDVKNILRYVPDVSLMNICLCAVVGAWIVMAGAALLNDVRITDIKAAPLMAFDASRIAADPAADEINAEAYDDVHAFALTPVMPEQSPLEILSAELLDATSSDTSASHGENTENSPEVPQAIAQPQADENIMTFDGRPLRKVRTMRMVVTAYSPDARSCGKWADGITASGKSVWTNGMKLVAADTRLLPFNTIITVPGYNDERPVQVLDRGGAIKGHRLDVLYPTHEIARLWGVQTLNVDIWEYAD